MVMGKGQKLPLNTICHSFSAFDPSGTKFQSLLPNNTVHVLTKYYVSNTYTLRITVIKIMVMRSSWNT